MARESIFRPMRPVRTLVIFLLAIFVGGALLAPWLYWLAHWAGERVPALGFLGQTPFHRFVMRALLVLALAGMWLFLRGLGARSWSAVGLTPITGQWRRAGAGFLLGFATLAVVAALALACGARQMDGNLSGNWHSKLPGLAFTAVLVAAVEEILFRGALFSALRRALGWKAALAASSAAYAVLHFFQTAKSPSRVTWSSGLEMLPSMMRGLVDPNLLIPGFFTLALAGMILALAYQRTGNLWFSIGLHAGWIFWLKAYNTITDAVPGAAKRFWGSGKLYDGWMSLLLMAAAAVVVWRLSPQGRAPADSTAWKADPPDLAPSQGCASLSSAGPCPPGVR